MNLYQCNQLDVFSYYKFVFMKTSIELNPKLKIVLGVWMIEMKEFLSKWWLTSVNTYFPSDWVSKRSSSVLPGQAVNACWIAHAVKAKRCYSKSGAMLLKTECFHTVLSNSNHKSLKSYDVFNIWLQFNNILCNKSNQLKTKPIKFKTQYIMKWMKIHRFYMK